MVDDRSHPFDIGIAEVTDRELKCSYCGTIHNKGLLYDEKSLEVEGDHKLYMQFGNLLIVECCFREFEKAVDGWLPYFVHWHNEQIKAHRLDAIAKAFDDSLRFQTA